MNWVDVGIMLYVLVVIIGLVVSVSLLLLL